MQVNFYIVNSSECIASKTGGGIIDIVAIIRELLANMSAWKLAFEPLWTNQFKILPPEIKKEASWISNSAGQPIQHLQYLPFGELHIDQRVISWHALYTFSGKEKDEESPYSYFGARYYDSDLSIWISVDPLASMYPGLSPYGYCMNNPLILVDPDGNTPWPALIAGIYYPKRTGDRAFSPSRKSPVDGVSRPHKGIDLGHHPIQGSLKGGESVLAAAEGVVSFVSKKESKSAGWYIEIDHGGGYTSRYLHLQEKPNLKKGDVITNEQEIGKVGSTGRSTGNHLHFEILKDGNPIDPTSIYDLQEVINPDNVGTKGYGLEGQPPIQLKPIDINAPKIEPIIDEINESTN